jgi:hypothetical protein
MSVDRLTPLLYVSLERLWISYLRKGEAYMLAAVHHATLLDERKAVTAQDALADLVEESDAKTLDMLLWREPTLNWYLAMETAARGGHVKAMLVCETNCPNHWDRALYNAALGGHVDAMVLCESKGANNWCSALWYAQKGSDRAVHN